MFVILKQLPITADNPAREWQAVKWRLIEDENEPAARGLEHALQTELAGEGVYAIARVEKLFIEDVPEGGMSAEGARRVADNLRASVR